MYENGYNVEPKWKEECGVYGVFSRTEDVSGLTYLGLYALQHRGQESAGIAITDGAWMDVTRGKASSMRCSAIRCRIWKISALPSAMYVIPPPAQAFCATLSR